MKLERAIEKAKEGGAPWEPWNVKQSHKQFITPEEVFMSPIFWQCLGKALGWGDESECPLACCGGICPINIPMWQSQWHRFISHLSGGGTIGSFFENIEE